MVFCYLLRMRVAKTQTRMRVAKTQTSLRTRVVSPEPLLLAGVEDDPD